MVDKNGIQGTVVLSLSKSDWLSFPQFKLTGLGIHAAQEIFDILLFPTSSFTLNGFCIFSISHESFDLLVWEYIAFQKTFPLYQLSCCLIWHQQLRTVSKHVDGFHIGVLPRCEIALRIYEHFYISNFYMTLVGGESSHH